MNILIGGYVCYFLTRYILQLKRDIIKWEFMYYVCEGLRVLRDITVMIP